MIGCWYWESCKFPGHHTDHLGKSQSLQGNNTFRGSNSPLHLPVFWKSSKSRLQVCSLVQLYYPQKPQLGNMFTFTFTKMGRWLPTRRMTRHRPSPERCPYDQWFWAMWASWSLWLGHRTEISGCSWWWYMVTQRGSDETTPMSQAP